MTMTMTMKTERERESFSDEIEEGLFTLCAFNSEFSRRAPELISTPSFPYYSSLYLCPDS